MKKVAPLPAPAPVSPLMEKNDPMVIEDEFDDDEDENFWQSLRGTSVRNAKEPKTRSLPEYEHVKCIVFPDDAPYVFWGYVIIGLLVYTALVTPFAIALIDLDQPGWFWTDLVVDMLFFTDVAINCFLAYHNDENVLITSHKQIFMHYLSTWMVIDTLACIPFQLLLSTSKDYQALVRVARLPRLYRLIKMAKLARMLKIVKHRRKIMRNMNNMMKVSFGVERLMWFAITFVVMIHLIACLWIMVGQLNEFEPDNWLLVKDVLNYDMMEMYMTSFYWTVTTITTVGYGDFSAFNTEERLFCSIIMIIGVFLYSYTIGSLSSLLSSLDGRRQKLNRKLELLADISKEFHLSKSFYNRVANALEYDHKQSRREIEVLLQSLPSNLRNQLLIVIYESKITNNAFFLNKPTQFVAYVAPLLKPQRIEAGDIIYKEGEYAAEMYFLFKGECAMILIKEEKSIPYLLLEQGYYFGEVDLLMSFGYHLGSVRANRKSDLLALSRENFIEMLDEFDEQKYEILALAKERHDRFVEMKQQAEFEFHRETEVSRHYSMPFNANIKKKKNPLWLYNQLDGTPSMGISTVVAEHEAEDEEDGSSSVESEAIKEESDENSGSNDDDDQPDIALTKQSSSSSSSTIGFVRKPTLYESIRGESKSPALSAASPWKRLQNTLNPSSDSIRPEAAALKSNNKKLERMEARINEVRYLVAEVCEKMKLSTAVPAHIGKTTSDISTPGLASSFTSTPGLTRSQTDLAQKVEVAPKPVLLQPPPKKRFTMYRSPADNRGGRLTTLLEEEDNEESKLTESEMSAIQDDSEEEQESSNQSHDINEPKHTNNSASDDEYDPSQPLTSENNQ